MEGVVSAPRDGVPNLSTLAETLRREFLERRRNVALVVLRRRACRCALGSIYRLPSGDLLVGRRRPVVQLTRTLAQARQQQVFLALNEVEEIVLMSEIGCEDGSVRLPLDEVRRTTDAVARGDLRPGVSLAL